MIPRNEDAEIRYRMFLERALKGDAVWIAESPDAVMILSSADGEDGLAVWGSMEDVVQALSNADRARGYSPEKQSLQSWISGATHKILKNGLLVAVFPVDQCSHAIFVDALTLQKHLLETAKEAEGVEYTLLETGMRRTKSKLKRAKAGTSVGRSNR